MSIKVVDTVESMGNFPVAYAEGIQFADGEDLQKKLDDGTLGGGAEAYTELSQEEYDALTDEEKANGTEYRTYDTGHIYKYGVLYGKDLGVSDEVSDSTVWSSKKTSGEIDKITYSTDANECIPALMKTARYNLINTSANVPNSNYSWVLTAEHIKLSTGQYYRIIQDINGTKSDGGTIKYTRTATSTDDVTWTWTDWVVDALISDTTSSATSTYSSAKIDKKFAPRHFGTDNKTLWLKLQLGAMTTHEPITVTDQYGGQVKILGMYDLSTYKSVKVIRISYGDWSTHSGTDVSTTTSGDGNYKIRRLFYCPDDNKYYLEIRQYSYISVEGAPDATMVTNLPVEESAMTLIPESTFATKKDIDGTTIQTTTTTSEEYYAITYGDDYNDPANQNILIQYKRSNFSPSTYILSAVSYATDTRETVSVAKISNNFAGSTYNLRFYVDKDNKTVYLRMPSYSSVSLQNLAFKSKAVAYTKVDSIPSTATTLTVTEYASISDTLTNTTSTWSSSKIAQQDGIKQVYVGTTISFPVNFWILSDDTSGVFWFKHTFSRDDTVKTVEGYADLTNDKVIITTNIGEVNPKISTDSISGKKGVLIGITMMTGDVKITEARPLTATPTLITPR